MKNAALIIRRRPSALIVKFSFQSVVVFQEQQWSIMQVACPTGMAVFVTYSEELIGLNSSMHILVEGSLETAMFQLFSRTVCTNPFFLLFFLEFAMRMKSCEIFKNQQNSHFKKKKKNKTNTSECIDSDNTAFARKTAGYAYLIYSFSESQNVFVRSVILLHNLFWFIIGVVTLTMKIKWLVWRLGIQHGRMQLRGVL